MGRILIKGGRLWDGEKFSRADILTDGAALAKIGNDLCEAADFVYDAAGKTVSAGLVDAHVHMRGVSSEEFGIQAEMSCFPFGVTAAADASGVYGDKALLESFMLKNVVFVCAGFRATRADFSGAEAMLARYGDKAVGIKVYFDARMSEVSDVTPLRQACEFASARGLRVMVHCSHSPVPMAEILDTLNPGDMLTHSFHGGENNAAMDDFEGIRRAKERGVLIDVGFAGHVHTDFAILEKAIRCGILPDLISTDITRYSAFTRGGRYGMTMCMNIARMLGVPEESVFKAVTSAPAKALGKAGEWGTLKPGCRADIAVFEDTDEGFDLTDAAGNSVHAENGYRCVLTVADGQVVYRH